MCVRCVNGTLIAAAFGMNRLQYVTIPRKLDTLSDVGGGSDFFIASTLTWVGETPFPPSVVRKIQFLYQIHIFQI
jgi:hypothetical protein